MVNTIKFVYVYMNIKIKTEDNKFCNINLTIIGGHYDNK